MVRVKRSWYCTNAAREDAKMDRPGCRERLEKWGMWPPLVHEPDEEELG